MRRLSREVSVEQAQRLVRSGLRTFVLSPVLSAEIDADQFQRVLSAYSSYFRETGQGHPPEVFVCVYGRRTKKAGADTRIVVACILEFESLKS